MSDHVMTQEIREALLSRVPFGNSATIEYTPPMFKTKIKDAEGNSTEKYEIPEDWQPVFIVKSMKKTDRDILLKMQNKQNKTDKEIEEYEKQLHEVCRKHIVGWNKFCYSCTGEPIVFVACEDGGISKQLFESDCFPVELVTELVLYITAISGLRKLDRSGL